MSEQRMVSVELLKVVGLDLEVAYGEKHVPLELLREIVDGPGVDPVARWDESRGVADRLGVSKIADGAELYLAAKSAQVQADDQAPYSKARLKRLVTQVFGDGYQIVPQVAPVQAVPDDWKLVPKEPTSEMLKSAVMERHGMATYRCVSTNGVRVLEEEAAEDYRAMLAAAPQPPKELTAQPSAVACPTGDKLGLDGLGGSSVRKEEE